MAPDRSKRPRQGDEVAEAALEEIGHDLEDLGPGEVGDEVRAAGGRQRLRHKGREERRQERPAAGRADELVETG